MKFNFDDSLLNFVKIHNSEICIQKLPLSQAGMREMHILYQKYISSFGPSFPNYNTVSITGLKLWYQGSFLRFLNLSKKVALKFNVHRT